MLSVVTDYLTDAATRLAEAGPVDIVMTLPRTTGGGV